MQKYFVSYAQAVVLKELGFDEPCFGFYSTLYDLMIMKTNGVKSLFDSECLAPLKAQVFEWFREKHNLASFIWYNSLCEKWRFDEIICLRTGDTLIDSDEQFQTYEEAESAAIDKLIELLK